uniref:Solute carrier family 45 member 3 n=1 Tax=Catharus ustulatus TaxID=91951 RepID=A0A8C3Y909_CATUS
RAGDSVAGGAGASMSLQSRRTQLLLVNSLTFGLEVCLAAGITYVPPLLLEVGVEEKFMTMVLGIGPVLGLVFVPLIGSASDHWHSSYGRRRPFIWVLCLGVLLSLFVIPHASSLASLCALNPRPLEIAFLILGIGLLDFCGQVCFTPLEALLSDLFQEPDNCRQAFSMYAFMISLGGCIGYLLPAIDWAFLAPYLGGQESCLFTLLALIFLGCVLATLFVTEEAAQGDILDGPALKDASPKPSLSCPKPSLSCWQLARGSCVLQGRQVLQAARSLCSLLPRLHGLYCRIPRVIRRLFVAELCSWMALMTFMLFYTDFVGEGLYHGVPRAKPGTEARRHYDEGEEWAGCSLGRNFYWDDHGGGSGVISLPNLAGLELSPFNPWRQNLELSPFNPLGWGQSLAAVLLVSKKQTYSNLGFLQIAKNIFPWLPERGTGHQVGKFLLLVPSTDLAGQPWPGAGLWVAQWAGSWHREQDGAGSGCCSPPSPILGERGVLHSTEIPSCSGSFPSSQPPLQCFRAAHKPGAATSPPRTFSTCSLPSPKSEKPFIFNISYVNVRSLPCTELL